MFTGKGGIKCGKDEVPGNMELHTVTFTSKSLSSMEWQYSNIECEALGILHNLEKLHHYHFPRK